MWYPYPDACDPWRLTALALKPLSFIEAMLKRLRPALALCCLILFFDAKPTGFFAAGPPGPRESVLLLSPGAPSQGTSLKDASKNALLAVSQAPKLTEVPYSA